MPITIPPEAKYYEMQIKELTEQRDLLKAQLKVREDEIKSLNTSLAEAGAKNASLELKILQIKKLLGINKED